MKKQDWIAGKSNEVLYTADDELPEGKNIGEIKTEATYKSDTTWEATKVVPKYQAIDHSKLVPLARKNNSRTRSKNYNIGECIMDCKCEGNCVCGK